MGIPAMSPIERVREAAIVVLSGSLPLELTLMTTEAGNDLELPVPSGYLRTPAIELTEQTVVEVITLRARFDAANAPMEYQESRFTTHVLWEARAVVVNDGRWDDADFMRVLDRLAGAFLRVVAARYPTLGYGDGTVLQTIPTGELAYTVDQARDPGGKRVRRVHVPFQTTVQEALS